jgi:D-mannonate dehydratase
MAIHPDDPPYPYWIPRIVSTEQDANELLNAAHHQQMDCVIVPVANFGSTNDLPGMVRGDHIHFIIFAVPGGMLREIS